MLDVACGICGMESGEGCSLSCRLSCRRLNVLGCSGLRLIDVIVAEGERWNG